MEEPRGEKAGGKAGPEGPVGFHRLCVLSTHLFS